MNTLGITDMKDQIKQQIDKELEFMLDELAETPRNFSAYREILANLTKMRIHKIIDYSL